MSFDPPDDLPKKSPRRADEDTSRTPHGAPTTKGSSESTATEKSPGLSANGGSNSHSTSSAGGGRSSGGAAFLVALGILLSRIAGLVRDRVFAHYLGNSDAAGAFRAALRIPNFLQNLFGEGVLSASFIPVYARLEAQKSPEAREVAGVVLSVLILVVSALVALGVLVTPLLVDLVAPGFEGEVRDLTVRIVRILFPGVGLLVLSAWCLGVLNSHRQFLISYTAPVLWNLAMIATLLFLGGQHSQNELVVWLAWGSVVGSLLQFGVQIPFVLRSAGRVPLLLKTKIPQVREVFRNLGPVLVGRGVVQISAYIDGMIASFLGPAAVSSIAYAQTIYLLPISLFGMAVAAAELPALSVAASGARTDEPLKNEAGKAAAPLDTASASALKQRIVSGRRRIAFFVIPSAVLFFLLGRWVIAALYQTGQFGPEDTLFVWYVLIGSCVGLLAATWGRLYSSVFYALRDTRTPLRFALIRVFLTTVLGLLFAFPLRGLLNDLLLLLPSLRQPDLPNIELSMGAFGLTASAGLAGWVEYLLLSRALRARIGSTATSLAFLARVWTAALLAAAAALALSHIAPTLQHVDLGLYDAGPLLMIAIYGGIYLLFAQLFGLEETRAITRRLGF